MPAAAISSPPPALPALPPCASTAPSNTPAAAVSASSGCVVAGRRLRAPCHPPRHRPPAALGTPRSGPPSLLPRCPGPANSPHLMQPGTASPGGAAAAADQDTGGKQRRGSGAISASVLLELVLVVGVAVDTCQGDASEAVPGKPWQRALAGVCGATSGIAPVRSTSEV